MLEAVKYVYNAKSIYVEHMNERADHMQFITDELPHALITYVFIAPKNKKACQRLAL